MRARCGPRARVECADVRAVEVPPPRAIAAVRSSPEREGDATSVRVASCLTAAATARIGIRLPPQVRARIESAAALEGVTVSRFIVAAATARADAVHQQHEASTTVPADFFDASIAACDEPAEPNPALVKAARRARDT